MSVLSQRVKCSHRKEAGLHSLDKLRMLAPTANNPHFEDQRLSQYHSHPAFDEKRKSRQIEAFPRHAGYSLECAARTIYFVPINLTDEHRPLTSWQTAFALVSGVTVSVESMRIFAL